MVAKTKKDPRTVKGACVKVPSGDRAYVEGLDSNDQKRVLITYESGLGNDSYPLHMLTLVQESMEVPQSKAPKTNELKCYWVVIFEARLHPYRLPKYKKVRVIRETPHTIRVDDGDRQWNQAKHKAWCLPWQESWEEFQRFYNDYQDSLDALSNQLRQMSRYDLLLKANPKSLNPLTPTVIEIHDPDYDHRWNLEDTHIWSPPKAERFGVERHTPVMLYTLKDDRPWGLQSQALYFACPDDATWKRIEDLAWETSHYADNLTGYLSLLETYAESSDQGENWEDIEAIAPKKPTTETFEALDQEYADAVQRRQAETAVNISRALMNDPFAEAYETEGREIAASMAIAPPTSTTASCQICRHRKLVGRGDRYDCQAGELDFPELIKFDFAHDNEGCKSFQPVETAIATTTVEVIATNPGDRRLQLEAEIQQGINQIKQGEERIWSAVAQIQQEELWKLPDEDRNKPDGYASFEEYCKLRWGWERSNAFEVAAAGRIIGELRESGIPEEQLPTSVSQVRSLKKVPAAQRVEVLQEAASDGKITAAKVKEAVARRILLKPTEEPLRQEPTQPQQGYRLWMDGFGSPAELFSPDQLGEVQVGDRVTVPDGKYEGRPAVVKEIVEGNRLPAKPKPDYFVPDGVLRLGHVDGGMELHGLVLNQARFAKLAALARSLDSSLATALFHLIDELPDETTA